MFLEVPFNVYGGKYMKSKDAMTRFVLLLLVFLLLAGVDLLAEGKEERV